MSYPLDTGTMKVTNYK